MICVTAMEFRDVVRRRRMVREFEPRAVPPDALERVLDSALRAPSAGFAQGLELVVLDRHEDIVEFWRLTDPWQRKHRSPEAGAPVIVLPMSSKRRYLERYSQPDKQGLGMHVEEGWPVPYWDLDAAMAVMLMLLAAVDEGLGAWFFGVFHGERELLEWLAAPNGCRPIGAVAVGYPAGTDRRRRSGIARARRTLDDVVHRGGWEKNSVDS
jgi:nitroreductase